MVLRFDSNCHKKKNEVYIIEATGGCGVAIKRWSNLRLSYGEFYERLVLRHLEMERTPKQLKLLSQFIKEAIGQAYKFRPRQLLRKTTLKRKSSKKLEDLEDEAALKDEDEDEDEDQNIMIDKDRGFFCSELCAKILKCCEVLIDGDRASCSYMPGSFTSAAKPLQLMEGAAFDNE